MIICIRTSEYNLHYDKWENSLTLLKDLVRDCFIDADQKISTCCNVYTYHGYELTYVDFYTINDHGGVLDTIKKRSADYAEYDIIDYDHVEGDLVLVDDEPSDEDGELERLVENMSITKYTGARSDNDISDFMLKQMGNRVFYHQDTLYGYEEGAGWKAYDKECLVGIISRSVAGVFDNDITEYLSSYTKRLHLVSDIYAKVKAFQAVETINPWDIIGFANGVYCNETGKFSLHSPLFRATLSTHVSYHMTIEEEDHALASCLETIFPNPMVLRSVMRWFGYLLVSGNPEKYFTIWHGATGNNGKSWVQRLIREALGDYYATVPISLITTKRAQSNSPTPELACFEQSLVVMSQEPDLVERMNAGRIKELTGNDTLYIRELYKSARSIRVRAKMVVVANNRIETVGLDSAIRRRFLVIPFESTFVSERELEHRKAKNLNTRHYYPLRSIDHLCKTFAPAFIRIAISQHHLYMKYGMQLEREFHDYTTEFIIANNKILKFIHRYLEQNVGEFTLIHGVYEKFKQWYRELYPSMRTPDYDAFLEELDKESIEMSDDRYIMDYRCTF